MKILTAKPLGLLAGLLTIAFSVTAQFNTHPTLKIGDLAPAISVDTWVRGTPLKSFEKGKVYVIDFWATWCGGCIASFPHISYIADKYKDQARFVSIDSYEMDVMKKGGDINEAVNKFLNTEQGKRLTLDVCVDGKANQMYENWIKPLRRNGFPTTFIIDQEGRLAWIDVNLDHLDWALQQVIHNTWNIKKAADVMAQKDAIEDRFFKNLREKDASVKRVLNQEILQACESLERQYPDRKDAASFYKLMALNELGKESVAAYLEEMAANPLTRNIHMSDGLFLTLRRTDLKKEDQEALAKVQERLLLNEHNGTGFGGKTVAAYEQLAKTYSLIGAMKKAIDNQEKAIQMARQENKSEDKIKEMNASLEVYRSGEIKKSK